MQCRICYDDEGDLVVPCACTGSLKYVHSSCLDGWRQTSDTAYARCTTCKAKYAGVGFVRDACSRGRVFVEIVVISLACCGVLIWVGNLKSIAETMVECQPATLPIYECTSYEGHVRRGVTLARSLEWSFDFERPWFGVFDAVASSLPILVHKLADFIADPVCGVHEIVRATIFFQITLTGRAFNFVLDPLNLPMPTTFAAIDRALPAFLRGFLQGGDVCERVM